MLLRQRIRRQWLLSRTGLRQFRALISDNRVSHSTEGLACLRKQLSCGGGVTPTPTMDLFTRLKHPTEAQQCRWLANCSKALSVLPKTLAISAVTICRRVSVGIDLM